MLAVWCVCCGGGTGLVGDLVCCLDASMVRRTLESWAVLCAAGTRPPSDVAFRGAMRRACGAAMGVEGAAMRLGMGCGWCAGGEGWGWGCVGMGDGPQ